MTASRKWFSIASAAAAAILAPGAIAAAQGAGDAMPMNTCQVRMTPEEAATTLRALQFDTQRGDVIDGGIVLRTRVDVRSKSETSVEGVLVSDFEFQRNGPFGIIRTAGDLAGVSQPFTVQYDPQTSMLTAMVDDMARSIDLFFEVKDVVARDATVSKMGGDTISAQSTDTGGPEFGMSITEARAVSQRTLSATAFGLPGLLEPVLRCDNMTTSVRIGSRLRMNYAMELEVKLVDETQSEAESAERSIGVSLRNGNLPTGSLSRSESERRTLVREALRGSAKISAAGDGLATGLLLDPGLIGTGPAQVVFFQDAFLTFRFDINDAPVLGVRRAQRSSQPVCPRGAVC